MVGRKAADPAATTAETAREDLATKGLSAFSTYPQQESQRLRSRPDTCAAAPATSLAGARGLRFTEKPRTSLRGVIHSLSRARAGYVPELVTEFPHLFQRPPISESRPAPLGFVCVLGYFDLAPERAPDRAWAQSHHRVNTLHPIVRTGVDAEETLP
jgi:hypothetical protein